MSSLPDDLLLSCVARVSILYYPTLSLVSKRFRSLLTSPELYKSRSLLNHTESRLYVCLGINKECYWLTLCRKPDQDDTKSSRYVLAKVPIPLSPPARFWSLVAVGSDIYNIAGTRNSVSSSTVSILDCWSHTWREAPSLRTKLDIFSASVVDQKIYVAGWCVKGDSLVEVLDTKTQIWDHVPYCFKTYGIFFLHSECIDRKFHMKIDNNVVAYNAEEGRWDQVGPEMGRYMFSDSYCVIENVLYSYCYEEFRWYDNDLRMWVNLQGLVGLPELPPNIKLADYGGNMVVLWYNDFPSNGGFEKMIWCAEIALERRNSNEIWGNVEWFDYLLTVHESSHQSVEVVKVLAATV